LKKEPQIGKQQKKTIAQIPTSLLFLFFETLIKSFRFYESSYSFFFLDRFNCIKQPQDFFFLCAMRLLRRFLLAEHSFR
jgi:hypothetical protein